MSDFMLYVYQLASIGLYWRDVLGHKNYDLKIHWESSSIAVIKLKDPKAEWISDDLLFARLTSYDHMGRIWPYWFM